MKTAISIPDELFQRAENFAHQKHMTRSALFTAAVKEYMQHHRDDNITEKLNEVYSEQPSSLDPILEELQHLSLPKEDW
jgi:metal-responsive CopG/Arc/MetJ family transcriptional regulator